MYEASNVEADGAESRPTGQFASVKVTAENVSGGSAGV